MEQYSKAKFNQSTTTTIQTINTSMLSSETYYQLNDDEPNFKRVKLDKNKKDNKN